MSFYSDLQSKTERLVQELGGHKKCMIFIIPNGHGGFDIRYDALEQKLSIGKSYYIGDIIYSKQDIFQDFKEHVEKSIEDLPQLKQA